MTLDEILAAGDTVEFKKYVREASISDVMTAQIKANKARIHPLADFAMNELLNRKALIPIHYVKGKS